MSWAVFSCIVTDLSSAFRGGHSSCFLNRLQRFFYNLSSTIVHAFVLPPPDPRKSGVFMVQMESSAFAFVPLATPRANTL